MALHPPCLPESAISSTMCPGEWRSTSNPRLCLAAFGSASEVKATEECANKGAVLATIDTREMYKAFKEFLPEGTRFYFWMTLHDRVKEGEFAWNPTYTDIRRGNPMTYTNWKEGHPLTGEEGEDADCVVMDTADYKWMNVNCSFLATTFCFKRGLRNQCPGGDSYVKAPGDICAYNVYIYNFTAQEAHSYCKNYRDGNHLPLQALTKAEENGFIDFLQTKQRHWISLGDVINEGKFVWKFTRQEAKFLEWDENEPDGDRRENCVAQNKKFKWIDMPCESPLPYVCQREIEEGATDLRMRVFYHVPPDKIYMNSEFNVTCSATFTEGNFTWVLTGKRNIHNTPAMLDATVENVIFGIKTLDGTCANKTVSTLSFKAAPKHDLMIVSCYSYVVNNPGICLRGGQRFSFCDVSRKFHLISGGPLKPIEMEVTYDGQPGRIAAGQSVTGNCSSLHDGTGRLYWIIYYPSGPELVTNKNKTFVSETNVKEGKGHLRRIIISVTMTPDLSGLAMGCFAYDVVKLRALTKDCWAGELYCKKSARIYVELNEMSTGLKVLIALLALLVGLACFLLALFLTKLGNINVYQGEEDELTLNIKMARQYSSARKSFQKAVGLKKK